MLQITDLHAEIDGKPILTGLSLAIGAGEMHAIIEMHAIMGRNGASNAMSFEEGDRGCR